jgi:NAD(P)-dependent dehydrogenase (short-subunit alcohol dehydrogenase family)
LGEAVVQLLLEEGYAVSAWDLSLGSLAKIKNEALTFEQIDTCDRSAMELAAKRAQERFGSVYGLVTMAAIYRTQPFLEIDEATWDQHFSINLRGTLLACQAVLPAMRAQKGGSIVMFSSSLARTGGINSASYSATKGGILGLMRSMALDVAGDSIRVNAVSPAIADTAMPRATMSAKTIDARAASNPMKRIGTPLDMAQATLFLLDRENAFMTGQDLRVNGGGLLF